MNIREKIKERMDTVEMALKQGQHLSEPDEFQNQMDNVTKFWSSLSEEDRDFLNAARFAVEENLLWE